MKSYFDFENNADTTHLKVDKNIEHVVLKRLTSLETIVQTDVLCLHCPIHNTANWGGFRCGIFNWKMRHVVTIWFAGPGHLLDETAAQLLLNEIRIHSKLVRRLCQLPYQ